jgi:hypothetical protein
MVMSCHCDAPRVLAPALCRQTALLCDVEVAFSSRSYCCAIAVQKKIQRKSAPRGASESVLLAWTGMDCICAVLPCYSAFQPVM